MEQKNSLLEATLRWRPETRLQNCEKKKKSEFVIEKFRVAPQKKKTMRLTQLFWFLPYDAEATRSIWRSCLLRQWGGVGGGMYAHVCDTVDGTKKERDGLPVSLPMINSLELIVPLYSPSVYCVLSETSPHRWGGGRRGVQI